MTRPKPQAKTVLDEIIEAVDYTPPVKEDNRPKADLDLDDPDVAEYVARVVVANSMDFKKAISSLFPYCSTNSILTLASSAKISPLVRKAIEGHLTIMGLDDASKTSYVKEMWRWLWSTDKDLKQTAARILGKGFVTEKAHTDKLETLKIEGLEQGIDTLFSDDQPEDEERENVERDNVRIPVPAKASFTPKT